MQVIHTTAELRNVLKAYSVTAFVPTMGNLHAGHLALVELANQQVQDKADACVVVSIFVNPLQFGPGEDLDSYPRTLAADCAQLETTAGADIVFVPTVGDMYPDFDGQQLNQTMTIQPPPIANQLCGASRPGHFEGVATVVMKLFNLVQPDIAVFGKKDFQQLTIIRELVKQFNLAISIVAGETVREDNGLAMSSRNGYLDTTQKQQATQLNQALRQVVMAVEKGQCDYADLEINAIQTLSQQGWQVDYIAIRSALTLLPASTADKDLVVLGAATIGKTRLIDNIEFCAKPLN